MVTLSIRLRSPFKLLRRKKKSYGKSRKLRSQSSTMSDTSDSSDESSLTRSIAEDQPLDKETKSDLLVVLDLDECLVHSERHTKFHDTAIASSSPKSVESFCVNTANGRICCQVKKRPHLATFLQQLSSRHEVHIFTASRKVYAERVLQHLDPNGTIFAKRWYRQHCHYHNGIYVKDLTVIDKPMDRIVLVDNNPISFLANPDNGILVQDFYDNPEDTALLGVLSFLDKLDKYPEVRPLLQERFQVRDTFQECANSDVPLASLLFKFRPQ